MDWIDEFVKKFDGNEMIAHLCERKFHGKLEINFAGGNPHSAHVNWCVKPYAGAPNLKEGGG